MTTRERKHRRAEQLRGWADKRQRDAAATFASHEQYRGDHAFNTQPGHIPERARVIAREDRAFASLEKAENMTARAEGIEAQLDTSIYSDDPDAVEALEQRIATLEAERDRIKAFNATARKGSPDYSLLTDSQRNDLLVTARVCPYQLGKGGSFPAYVLSNLSGNIKRNRDRLAEVRRRQQRQTVAEEAGGITITGSETWAVVTFAHKPEREVLDALKAAGFRWSGGSWHGSRDRLPAEVKGEPA